MIALLLTLSVAGYAQHAGETDGYSLVWSDDFNGTALDTDMWNVEVNGNGGGNNELQYYRAENVSIGHDPSGIESCLVLTAKREDFSGKIFTSGRVNTKGRMDVTHGKIEARIRLPRTANGLWPAFWMMGSQAEWPMSGEIDIVEMGSANGISTGMQSRLFNGACHWGPSSANAMNYAQESTNSTSLQDDFHLFTLIWDTEYVRMYLDLDKFPNSAPYYEMYIPIEIPEDQDPMTHPSAYLHKPAHILFNLAVGGLFTGILDPGGITAISSSGNLEAGMYVDYVRVYHKNTPGSFEEIRITPGAVKRPVQSGSGYILYPNPASTTVHIQGLHLPEKITIYDTEGKKISDHEHTDVCDISALPSGAYLMRIVNRNEKATLRFVKK